MADNIRTANREATRVACIRHVGPYHEIGAAFDRVFAWAGARGVMGGPPGSSWEVIGIYYDNPRETAATDLRSDAGITLADDFVCTEEDQAAGIIVRTLPAGAYLVATHTGPYSGLAEAWNRFIGTACQTHDLSALMESPCFEVYLNDPCTVPEDELRTDLYTPMRLTSPPLTP